jgi:NADPH:quinone reductase-like Zn-dependent oxidoreductase
MKALQLFGNEDLRWVEAPDINAVGPGEAIVKIRAITLNHLDLFSYRGMAFAKRTLPIIVGAEGVGEVIGIGESTPKHLLNSRVAIYPSLSCNDCQMCRAGKDNLCHNIAGIFGFSADGVAAEYVRVPSHLLIPIPDGLKWEDAACAPITFSTVVHMLFDNAKLAQGESVLVHAGGSGIGSTAVKIAKHIGAEVYTTVGSDAKATKATEIGADYVINYSKQFFAREIRKLTKKQGVNVVFEHVGADTWEGSISSLCKGGRLVTCGSSSGSEAKMNLFPLFNQQIKIFGSFGGSKENIQQSLELMSTHGILPVIDSILSIDDYQAGLQKLRNRDVFGKIVLRLGE